jgi:hypothetical protein
MDTWYEQYKTASSYWTIGQVYTDDSGISYDVHYLVQLTQNHEVEKVSPSSLEDMLKNDVWGVGHNVLTPQMVLDNPDKDKEYKKHSKRIKKANLDKPILIRKESGDIIDGYHRLCKALAKDKNLKAIYVTEEDLDQSKLTNFS